VVLADSELHQGQPDKSSGGDGEAEGPFGDADDLSEGIMEIFSEGILVLNRGT